MRGRGDGKGKGDKGKEPKRERTFMATVFPAFLLSLRRILRNINCLLFQILASFIYYL